jgi:hypothetical protein
MIDQDEFVNFYYSGDSGSDRGTTKDVLRRVKSAIEEGLYIYKHQLPEELKEETYDKDASIGRWKLSFRRRSPIGALFRGGR